MKNQYFEVIIQDESKYSESDVEDAIRMFSPHLELTVTKKIEDDNEVVLKNWKGKSGNEITLDGTFFTVVNYRKQKEKGDVNRESHIISMYSVNLIFNIIKDLQDDVNKKGEIVYRQIAKIIIDELGLKVGLDAFNGGRNRKMYFKNYYYPVKILEHYKIISYGGKGHIKLLQPKFEGFIGKKK